MKQAKIMLCHLCPHRMNDYDSRTLLAGTDSTHMTDVQCADVILQEKCEGHPGLWVRQLRACVRTMKHAKIMPWGRCSPLGLSAGVHRNTNVYMLPSNSDCIAPSSAIFWSARARGRDKLVYFLMSGGFYCVQGDTATARRANGSEMLSATVHK